MQVGELLNHLHQKLVTLGAPQLPKAALLAHLNAAYRAFVNGMEGVPDVLEIHIAPGQVEVPQPKYVLKIKSARKADGREVVVYNRSDLALNNVTRYLGEPGELRFILIGSKSNVIQLGGSPLELTTLQLDIDRLPIANLADMTDEPADVPENWHLDMLDEAVYRVCAMSTSPEVTALGGEARSNFVSAYRLARSEKARSKSKKVRVVAYGGL